MDLNNQENIIVRSADAVCDVLLYTADQENLHKLNHTDLLSPDDKMDWMDIWETAIDMEAWHKFREKAVQDMQISFTLPAGQTFQDVAKNFLRLCQEGRTLSGEVPSYLQNVWQRGENRFHGMKLQDVAEECRHIRDSARRSELAFWNRYRGHLTNRQDSFQYYNEQAAIARQARYGNRRRGRGNRGKDGVRMV